LTSRYLESEANGEKIQMPQIRVVVVKGKEDVTIKVADRGGGIPRSKVTNILKFAQSTAGEEENSSDFGRDEVTGTKIRGFGLPLARIYARYLGGELTLKSMEGYGLDAYLQLPRLGDSCENLPLPVKFSPGELNSNPPRRAAGVL
jgi:pyruvate dehydrogenase kinase 2/3/4